MIPSVEEAASRGTRYYVEAERGVITLVRCVKDRDTDRMSFGSLTELAEVGEWMMAMADTLGAPTQPDPPADTAARLTRTDALIQLVRSCCTPKIL